MAIVISDKTDFKEYYKRQRRTLHNDQGIKQEEDITIKNINTANIEAPQYIRQTLTGIRGEIDRNTIIVRDFNTPFIPMDRLSKQNQ